MSVRRLSERPGGVIGKTPTAGSGVWTLNSLRQYLPLTIPGLQVWLDAADIGSFTFGSGTAVSEWRDRSGNGRHATQSQSGNRPSRSSVKNGLGAVAFAGSPNQWLNLTYTSFSQAPATYFFVANVSASASTQRNLFAGASGNILFGMTNSQFVAANAGSAAHLTITRPDSGWTTVNYRQGANTAGAVNTADGAAASTTGTTATATGYTSASAFYIGRLNFSSPFEGFFLGDIAEVVVYNRSLSDAERDAVLGYLRPKWSVT